MPPEERTRSRTAVETRARPAAAVPAGDVARGRRRLCACHERGGGGGRRHAGLCRPLRSRRVRGRAGARGAAADRAPRALCRAAALADALAVHAPPERPISFDWPDAVRVDGGLVGGGRLAWPQGANENAPPDWLVFGAMIRTVAMGEDEPGAASAVVGARGGRLRRSRLRPRWWRASRAISWSRSTPGRRRDLPRWRRTISRGWRPRRDCAATSTTTAICWCGAWARAEAERRSLVRALAAPSWLDPATGGPRR